MADKWPLANGNWSNAANWNGGVKPVSGDGVYADGKTVAIDETPASGITLRNSQRSGGTAGGGFTLATSLTFTGNIVSSTQNSPNYLLTVSGSGNLDIVGDVSHTVVAPQDVRYAIYWGSSGSLSIVGNVSNSSTRVSGGIAIISMAGGTINVTGTINQTGNCPLFTNNAGVTINITGAVSCGGNSAIFTAGSHFTANVVGNVTASSGPLISNTSWNVALTVTGNVVATGTSFAILNTPIAASNNIIGNVEDSATAHAIAATRLKISSGSAVTWKMFDSSGSARILYTAEALPGMPAAGDVRSGTTYGPISEVTGTLAVPPVGSVALGVPVDNTTGTAVLTQQDIIEAVAIAAAAFGT